MEARAGLYIYLEMGGQNVPFPVAGLWDRLF